MKKDLRTWREKQEAELGVSDEDARKAMLSREAAFFADRRKCRCRVSVKVRPYGGQWLCVCGLLMYAK